MSSLLIEYSHNKWMTFTSLSDCFHLPNRDAKIADNRMAVSVDKETGLRMQMPLGLTLVFISSSCFRLLNRCEELIFSLNEVI
ncbi:hypothetical protein HNY73_004392 [Argiope bruennichi]|uniref:Uncharacterized protein n=1 Tax=Argiope bruennichi TaxID=94029 RepID=A0A8T0FVS0_ARGBR|nr:hypothetical protein HNY73_004392 [Argiope bruennichi]